MCKSEAASTLTFLTRNRGLYIQCPASDLACPSLAVLLHPPVAVEPLNRPYSGLRYAVLDTFETLPHKSEKESQVCGGTHLISVLLRLTQGD